MSVFCVELCCVLCVCVSVFPFCGNIHQNKDKNAGEKKSSKNVPDRCRLCMWIHCQTISIPYSILCLCVCVEKCFLGVCCEKTVFSTTGSKLSRLHIDDTTVGKKNEKRKKTTLIFDD